jgi:cell division protease FtsH
MEMAKTTSSENRQRSSQRDGNQAGDHQEHDASRRRNSPRSVSFWLRLLLVMFLINLFFYGPTLVGALGGQAKTINLTYSRFLQQVERGNVTTVTIKSDNSVTGAFKTPVPTAGQGSQAATQFATFIPATGDPSLLPLLKKQGVDINAQPAQSAWWETALVLLLNTLPILLLLFFGLMSWRGLRQMQNMQGGGISGLTRSRARLYTQERPRTTF